MRYNASTIPRTPRGGSDTFFEGRLVQASDGNVFLSVGNVGEYREGEYAIAQFGESDGISFLPRPEVRDQNNNVVIPGDRLLVAFLGRSSRRPVVFPGIRFDRNDFLPRNHKERRGDKHDVNRHAYRRRIYDANGTKVGDVEIEVGKDGKPIIRIGANEKIVLEVGKTLGADDGIQIEIEDGKITIAGGTKGAARDEDPVTSTSTDDPVFWTWIAAAGSVLSGIGVTAPIPTSLKGKISAGSSKTFIG